MALLEAVIRRFPAIRALGDGTTAARLTGMLSLAMAQTESPYQDMTRSGRRFGAIGGTTGVAPVQTVPTTAAAWALYNPDSSRCYVIDEIAFFILSGVPGSGGTIFHIVSQITATLPPAATGSLISQQSGGGLLSKAIFATGYTLPTPVLQTQWSGTPGQQGQVGPGTAIVSIGGLYNAAVAGRIIIPPGKVMGLTMLANAGTAPLYIPLVNWHEEELDLE